MLSLKDRLLLRAGFCLMVLSAGWTSPVAAEQERDNPRFSYLLHCSGCHIEDGSGDPLEVPDLRKNLDKLLQSATGRSYMLQCPESLIRPSRHKKWLT